MTFVVTEEAPDWHPLVAKHRAKVHFPATTGTLQLWTGEGSIMALVAEETTGSAAARFELWDGITTGGEYLGPWTLSESQSFDSSYPPHGLPFRAGVFLNVTSGSVAGVLYIATLVPWPLRDTKWGRD